MAAFTNYTAAQARARALSHSTWQVGYCLNFVWTCLDYPTRLGLPDANAGWSATTQRVYAGTPPAGAPLWWAGGRHGHVALSLGNGYARSTDWPSSGRVGKVAITDLTRAWGLTYRGWTRDYGGRLIAGLQPAAAYPPTRPVDLAAPITLANLRYQRRHRDVARFELAMWNYLGGPYRQSIAADQAHVGDDYYGTLTQKMCGDSYRRLRWTVASQPGPRLLARLGFTAVR